MSARQNSSKNLYNGKKKNLDELSVYKLITDIYKATSGVIKRETDDLDLPDGYRNLINRLSGNDGMTQLDIAKATGLTPPTISVTLRKMEAAGLVTRKTDQNDLRQTRVFLTDKGRQADKAIAIKTEQLSKLAIECLSKQEQDTLKNLLIKVRNNVIPPSDKYFG